MLELASGQNGSIRDQRHYRVEHKSAKYENDYNWHKHQPRCRRAQLIWYTRMHNLIYGRWCKQHERHQ
jgi:hypothetical protein